MGTFNKNEKPGKQRKITLIKKTQHTERRKIKLIRQYQSADQHHDSKTPRKSI